MSSKRDGLAHSVQVRLARHAKETGLDPGLVFARYGVERFLYRLSRSRYSEQFILKGALLLLVWLGETIRPTRDADLLGFGDLSNEPLTHVFREVCQVEVEPDAMTFDPGSVAVAPIRDEDVYGGQRVTLRGKLGTARLAIQVDIGIGDAVTPAPQWLDYPSLLGLPRPRLRAYPRETVVAEKVHGMVLLGARNSRMKDYFDVHALLCEERMSAAELANALAATFERRRTALPDDVPSGLSDRFAGDAAKQAQWQAFLKRNRLSGSTLNTVVTEIRERLAGPLAAARKRWAKA
ncbi:MAG TPA: nucleotidyl transferase AbiEii/AbiGii toxin family protein [Burkholderiales bacterium]|nr:nucleotidyl transferase AbiEii/AbiGii toxin family protein [Burkholderiales bacterium]